MKKIIPALFFLLVSIKGLTQDKRVILKISPLSLIDGFSFPTIQGGIEVGLSKKFSWYNELGVKYIAGFYEKADTTFNPSKGFKFKSEFKYYSKSLRFFEKNLERCYLAVNLFYTTNFYNTIAYYNPNKDSSIEKVDNFSVKKTNFGSNILAGGERSVGKKIIIEFYAGFGIRYRDVFTSNKEFKNNQDHLITSIDLTAPGLMNQTDVKGGDSFLMNTTLGLRICFKL